MASTAAPGAGSAGAPPPSPRPALRRRLLAEREQFAAGPEAAAAHAALAGHLARLLPQLEPDLLGVYWPVRGEFNAIDALRATALPALRLALPYAQREPREMHYRAWDGAALASVDECGLPAPASGAAVVPDVILVPCVGYTRSGYRLGYGGGYFDRWLAAHPHVTAVGIAWSIGELDEAAFAPAPHDRPLMAVLTERGVAG